MRSCVVRSHEPKANNLSLKIGPPRFTPYCLRLKTDAGFPMEAEVPSLRYAKKPSPWIAFVPDRVVMLTVPEEVSSVAKSRLDWLTWNSLMELTGMFCVVVPTVSSLISNPSTSIRAVRPKRPPKEIDEKPFL